MKVWEHRGDRTGLFAQNLPHVAHMRLIRKPVRPKWRPVISLVLGNQKQHEVWKDFLDVAYWNVELEE